MSCMLLSSVVRRVFGCLGRCGCWVRWWQQWWGIFYEAVEGLWARIGSGFVFAEAARLLDAGLNRLDLLVSRVAAHQEGTASIKIPL